MISESIYLKRQMNVRKVLEGNRLEAILFYALENIRYLSGFTGSDGAFLLTEKDAFFLTDSRYWTQADEEVKGCRIVHYKKKMDGIASLLLELKLARTGFESSALPYSSYQSLLGKLPKEAALLPLEEELKNLRAVKDSEEMKSIRGAIEIATNSFRQMMEKVKEGVSEGEMAQEMEFSMRKGGSEAIGFDIIFASGKRAALPHGKAGEKRIEKGDFILIDFGATFQGYHSDQTRTLVCGRPSPEQEKVYRIVKEAHDRAIEKVRPGIQIHEVDDAARNHIKDAGYGEYFGHATGHGIGLAVHEDPGVNWENKTIIQEGMIFTVEPGIYIPNWGGVRIEDMVLVTSKGAEILTPLPTDLQIV